MDDPQALAEASAAALARLDRTKPFLGIEVLKTGPGSARLAMTVRPEMANGHGDAHGGMIFTLADAALGSALNSRGEAGVSAHCAIDFVGPARVDERLLAVATITAEARRAVFIDVRVETEDGRLVALLRGQGRKLGRSLFADGKVG